MAININEASSNKETRFIKPERNISPENKPVFKSIEDVRFQLKDLQEKWNNGLIDPKVYEEFIETLNFMQLQIIDYIKKSVNAANIVGIVNQYETNARNYANEATIKNLINRSIQEGGTLSQSAIDKSFTNPRVAKRVTSALGKYIEIIEEQRANVA